MVVLQNNKIDGLKRNLQGLPLLLERTGGSKAGDVGEPSGAAGADIGLIDNAVCRRALCTA